MDSYFRHYEDDFEPDDEDLIQQELNRVQQSNSSPQFLGGESKDDLYDFSTNNLGYWLVGAYGGHIDQGGWSVWKEGSLCGFNGVQTLAMQKMTTNPFHHVLKENPLYKNFWQQLKLLCLSTMSYFYILVEACYTVHMEWFKLSKFTWFS